MRVTFAPWGETLDEMADVSRRAEAAGAEVLWVQELHRTASISAAAIAAATERAQIGTAIMLAFTRSPMITALEALDIDELSGGRFVLGIGSGVRRLNEDWHNARWGKPVAHLKETVRNIRHFWAACRAGKTIDLDGVYEPMRIRGYHRPYQGADHEIPVYLAAMGPATTRLAGSIGDGWISHELCSPRYLTERVLPELETGIARTPGKSRADVDVVVSACCSVAHDPEVALQRAKGVVGFYASVRTYKDFFELHGLGEQQQRVIDAFEKVREPGRLAEQVTPEMVRALSLTGTPDDVMAQLAEYEGRADSVKLSPPAHGLAPAEIRAAQDEIIALIACLTGDAR